MKKYIWNVLIGFDQFCNAILGGDPDETISGRMGRWRKKYPNPSDGWRYYVAKYLAHWLGVIDKGHCEDAIEPDEGDDEVLK